MEIGLQKLDEATKKVLTLMDKNLIIIILILLLLILA